MAMGLIHPELSESNEYYIEKHRYYELKHFCLQYPVWKRAYLATCMQSGFSSGIHKMPEATENYYPLERIADDRVRYSLKIDLVERIVRETDLGLSRYLLKGVTEEVAYGYLRATMGIPCCRNVYYSLYRRFFYLLDSAKD
jgi:hypothetical protein